MVRDRLDHHPPPAFRLVVVERQHRPAELAVEVRAIRRFRPLGVPDRPAGHALDPSFRPPAVEDAEIEHPVERRLHAAGAGSLHRRHRVVQPHVGTRHAGLGDIHVVVRQERPGDLALQAPQDPVAAPRSFPCLAISRGWALPAITIWNGWLGGNRGKAIEVGEQQRRPLVRGHAPGEADDRHVRSRATRRRFP